MLQSGDINFTNNVNSRNLLDCHDCFGGQELSVGDRVEVNATGFEFAGLYAGMRGTVLGLSGYPEWDEYGLDDWILVQWDNYENGWWGGTPECGSNPTDCEDTQNENNGAEGCNDTTFWNITCAYTTLLDDEDDCFVVGPDAGCDGVCFSGVEEDCTGECGGSATADCAGECGGSAVEDDCGECGGDNSTCTDECGIVGGQNFCDNSFAGDWSVNLGYFDANGECLVYDYSYYYEYYDYYDYSYYNIFGSYSSDTSSSDVLKQCNTTKCIENLQLIVSKIYLKII